MHFHLSWSGLRAILPFLILLTLVALRVRGRRGRSGEPATRGFRVSRGAVGNALQQLQILVDPGVRYLITQKFDERSEDDGEDDPTDPVKHLERQLRRIRHGESIDRLTILRRDRD